MYVRPASSTRCRCPYGPGEPFPIRRIFPDPDTARVLREHGIPGPWHIVYAHRR